MSETQGLTEIMQNLRLITKSLQTLVKVFTGNECPEETQPKQPAAAHETKPDPPAVTLEQVRAVLAEKSQNGFTAEVRGLLEKHGAKKLSEINPGEFPALLAEAEALQ